MTEIVYNFSRQQQPVSVHFLRAEGLYPRVKLSTPAIPPPDPDPNPRVLLEGTDVVLTCRPGQPILEAAFEAGIALPYACRRGICGLCAADVIQGRVTGVDTLPMTHPRCDPAQVLLCRCTPRDDVVTLRPSSWSRLPRPRRLPAL